MNKQNLDEMQVQYRNKIGSQAFLILLYLLLIDAGLYGFGFRWINYPANIMIILTLCSGYYVVRLLTGNAFVGPSTKKQDPLIKALLMLIISVSLAIVIIFLLKNANFTNSNQINESSAPILFIAALIALVITVITAVVKAIQNKEHPE